MSYHADIRLQTALEQGKSVEQDPGWEILNGACLGMCGGDESRRRAQYPDYYGAGVLRLVVVRACF